MSSHLTATPPQNNKLVSSAEMAATIKSSDFSNCAATVVGYGNMGKHFVKALRALGLGSIRVCSRSKGPLAELKGLSGVTAIPGGYSSIEREAVPGELGIVATPCADLVGAAEHLAALGFRKILIEKPVSLWASRIHELSDSLERQGIDVVCAYNRVAYPSFIETRTRAEQDGGITSCTYTFTEFVDRIGPGQYSNDELARWGIANSLHVITMAHGLIGLPGSWAGFRSGSISWHPSGSVFVGSGATAAGVPFSYHADWGSTGRWSVEVHTPVSSYRLCPLEKLFTKSSATENWDELSVGAFDPKLKAGLAEQVAAMLKPEVREIIPLVSLEHAARLAEFGEEVFGYSKS